MDKALKKETRKGIIWSGVQRFSTQGLQFLVTLVIARFLTPHDYGTVGMLGIFLAIASVFIDCGFTSALTRKSDRNQADCSTVFFFNIAIAFIAYIILFICAPYIALFYNMPPLAIVLRIMGITLIINSFAAVQATLLTANLNFKSQSHIAIISLCIAGSMAIVMAIQGHSYWALVVQSICSSTISTALYWHYSSWRPSLTFSKKSFNELFGFGSKLLATSLIDTIYNNIYSLIIGKFFSSSILGNYSRAESYANFPSVSFTGIIQRVTYPVLCKLQDDEDELSHDYRKFLKLSAFIIFPLMMGLSALSYPFIMITIGHQWEFCSLLLKILCFGLMWYPIHAINLSLLQVKGRTDLALRLEILKKIVGVIILCISVPFGIIIMCYSRILNSVICLFINSYYSKELINLSTLKQLHDLLPTFLISFAMFLAITVMNMYISNVWLQLVMGSLVGGMIYLSLSYLFNREEFTTITSLIQNKS